MLKKIELDFMIYSFYLLPREDFMLRSFAVSIECAGERSVNKLLPKANEPPRKGIL